MKSESKRWSRTALVILACMLVVPMLAACASKSGGDSEETRVLRIAYMYGDSSYDDYMRTQYTDLFQFEHKNIEIELIPAVDWSKQRYQDPSEPYREPNPVEEMKKLMEGDNPPDVVIVGYDELHQLVEENLLMPLDPLIEEDKFDISDFVPAVINGLKEAGDGKLYALAPTFYGSALIYNKKIFAERGVEPPTDNMTWDQVFDLARRVAHGEGNDRVYGFSFSQSFWDDLFWGMDIYISPLGLKILDDNAETLLVDSPLWEQVWTELSALKQEKIFPEPPNYDEMDRPARRMPFEGDAFLSGKLAMAVTSYSYLAQVIAANNNAASMEGFEPIEWDVVTMPVHEEAPGKGGTISMDPILAINAKAQNSKDAWEFIKFLNGEDWAELKSRSLSMMVSRQSFIKPQQGLDYNIAAFYTLTPVRSVMNLTGAGVDPQIRQNLWQVTNIGYQKLMEVINTNKPVADALKEWKTEGEAILKQLRENSGQEPPMQILPMDGTDTGSSAGTEVEAEVIVD